MLLVADLITMKGDRIADRKIRAITPISVDPTRGSSRAHADYDRARAQRLSVCGLTLMNPLIFK
jgi:hypothetical protein